MKKIATYVQLCWTLPKKRINFLKIIGLTKFRKSYFKLMNLIFQKWINIRFDVHDPAMVLRYLMLSHVNNAPFMGCPIKLHP